MDFVERIVGQFGQPAMWQPSTFLKFSNLDERVQKHLLKTYTTLASATLVLCLGVYAHIAFNLAGFLTQMVAFGSLVALGMYAPTPANLNTRYGLLASFSFCQGVSLGPLINLALMVQPSMVLTAAVATFTIFACFSLAALMTNRRAYLFLGGFLSSALMSMMVLRFGSYFLGGRSAVFSLELYGGLLVFAGYVLFDTQLIVEKAYAGQMDHVRHAQDLLIDLVSIFVRVLIIIMKNQEKAAARERERQRKEKSRSD